MNNISNASVLIVIGGEFREIKLTENEVRFGRACTGNGICVNSEIVSKTHGRFLFEDGNWYYQDLGSRNGTFIDDEHLYHTSMLKELRDGEVLRIDTLSRTGVHQEDGVLLYFFLGDLGSNYTVLDLTEIGRKGTAVTIGRDRANTVRLDTVTVSRHHASIKPHKEGFTISDLGSTNGTFVNGKRISSSVLLYPGDILLMGNIRLIFAGKALIYSRPQTGSYLSIRGLYRDVPDMDNKGKMKTILHNVNVDISESELVAVLGTSGAGKTTFMNCVIGYESATGGKVMVNGAEINGNDKELRRIIGYVPQQDLLRDGLSVESTLDYIADLRLPADVNTYEKTDKINSVLNQLDLEPELKKNKIKKLSGGQKKRVSIASELISDPPLMFLDEPTSGLDPETETNLVKLLRKLAHEQGKTLIVVTHTIRNIMQFDRVLFFGPGGHLCYSGSPEKAMKEFEVDDFVDIYTKVRENVNYYYQHHSTNSADRIPQGNRGTIYE